MIRFIAAIDSKKGLADDQGIPWRNRVPNEVQYFRKKTLNGVLMMGHGWYKELHKPMPERRNIVATTVPEPLKPGFEKTTNARKFLEDFAGPDRPDIWVGGGAGLFASTLDMADELYLTQIEEDFKCTKFFPEFHEGFKLKSESQPVTENGVTYRFQVWSKK